MLGRSIARLASLAALICACRSGAGTDDDGAATESDGPEPRPTPDFIEPASDEMLVGVLTRDDLSLLVASVLPGITTLVVDGVDVGPLQDPGGIGSLDAERLTLRLDGAMVPSPHEIQLRTPDADELLHSRTIRVVLAHEPAHELVLELAGEDGPAATALVAMPLRDDTLLAVIDHAASPDPIVRVSRLVDGAWSFAEARQVAAPGLRQAAGERGAALSVHLADLRLRMAWRVGHPGERIDAVEVDWEGEDAGVPFTALGLDAALVGAVEWAEYGRPLVVGDRIVAELARHADVEAPVPGDLALATALLESGGVVSPQLLALGETADLDAIAPAVDLRALSDGDVGVVSLRLGRRRPALLDIGLVDAAPRLRPSVIQDDSSGLDVIASPLATVAGAFGSRTIAAFDEPHLRVLRWDDSGMGGIEDVSPPEGVLPPSSDATGEIATTVVGGAPVFVLPYGADSPLFAAIVTEASTTVQQLSAEGCDAVAAAASAAGNDAGTTAIACLKGGVVVGGRLRIAP